MVFKECHFCSFSTKISFLVFFHFTIIHLFFEYSFYYALTHFFILEFSYHLQYGDDGYTMTLAPAWLVVMLPPNASDGCSIVAAAQRALQLAERLGALGASRVQSTDMR